MTVRLVTPPSSLPFIGYQIPPITPQQFSPNLALWHFLLFARWLRAHHFATTEEIQHNATSRITDLPKAPEVLPPQAALLGQGYTCRRSVRQL